MVRIGIGIGIEVEIERYGSVTTGTARSGAGSRMARECRESGTTRGPAVRGDHRIQMVTTLPLPPDHRDHRMMRVARQQELHDRGRTDSASPSMKREIGRLDPSLIVSMYVALILLEIGASVSLV